MSWQALAAVQKMAVATASQKLVLLMLAYHHNDETDQCNPSLRLLEEETCLARTSVVRVLNELAALGLIAIKKEPRGRSNHHELLFLGGSTTLPGGSTTLPEHQRTSTSTDSDSESEGTSTFQEGESEGETLSDGMVVDRTTGEILIPAKPKRKPPASAEMLSVMACWDELGFGPVSQTTRTKLRVLVSDYGVELVKLSLSNAAEKQAKWPVSWAASVIGGIKRTMGKEEEQQVRSKSNRHVNDLWNDLRRCFGHGLGDPEKAEAWLVDNFGTRYIFGLSPPEQGRLAEMITQMQRRT